MCYVDHWSCLTELSTFEIVLMPKKRHRPNLVVPRRIKQRDGFSPVEGFCIVDLALLSNELQTMAVCGRCKKGTLHLKMNEKMRLGFASKLVIECSYEFCGRFGIRTGSEFYSSKRVSFGYAGPFEINRRMVLMAREIGCGHAALEKLAAVVGLAGGLSSSSFSLQLRAVEAATTVVADECMAKAAAELFELARATADDDNPSSGPGGEPAVTPPLNIAVSCDGTWQWRGHQSLYGVQAAISSETGKVLDYEIQSKFCAECQAHANWDQTTVRYQNWKITHQPACNINYHASSKSMEAYGAEKIWCRSLAKHNLQYTTYIGDGDSASHKRIIEAAPYGDTLVEKSDCTGHVQKRMGTALRELISKHKGKEVIPTPGGTKRKGIQGKNGLTKKVVDQIQNYYGMAIRSNIGNKEGMIKAIKAIFGHFSNDHEYCPDDETTWCKFKRNYPSYKPKDIAPEVLALMEPIFDRLSDSDLLERLQQGDTQNPNESLHSLIWKRAPKHIFASPEAIRVSTALSVIHRNVGNVGLLDVLKALGIKNNNYTCRALEKMDVIKATSIAKNRDPKVKKQRQLLRRKRKRDQDEMEEAEEPSYEAGGFDLPDEDQPGPSGIKKKKQPRKRKDQTVKPAREEQPTKKKKGKQPKLPTPDYDDDDDDDDDDDNDDDNDDDDDNDNDNDTAFTLEVSEPAEIQPTRRSTRVSFTTQRSHPLYYFGDEYGDIDDED